MNKEERSQELKRQAVELGLCRKWTNEWTEGLDADELIDRYIRGIDFCIARDYPSRTDMRKMFTKEEMERNGVFLDSDTAVTNRNGTIVMNGDCDMKVIAAKNTVTEIYLRHGSKLKLGVGDIASVTVNVYDGAELNAVNMGFGKLLIVRHTESCRLNIVGTHKIIVKDN